MNSITAAGVLAESDRSGEFEMKVRVITSIVGLGVLAIVLCFFDTVLFNFVLMAVALIAIHEVYDAFQLKAPYVYAAFVPLTAVVMFSDALATSRWIWIAGYVMMVYLACCVISHSQTLSFAKVAGTTLFSAVILACFASVLHVRGMFPDSLESIYVLLMILGFAWGGDTCAYFAGRAFGKHKLAPIVSPHKTVEGAIGGVLGSVLVGLLITVIYAAAHDQPTLLSAWGNRYYVIVALLGAIGSLLGILGDLTASVVKRQCGIKDYGTIFPGHGGIMDRFDSVMFVAPFVVLTLMHLPQGALPG